MKIVAIICQITVLIILNLTVTACGQSVEVNSVDDIIYDKVMDVVDETSIPTVEMEVFEDSTSGWNLEVETTNFELVPDPKSELAIEGTGHIHLFINGKVVTSLESYSYHLGELDPGEHELAVVLFANPSDAALTIDGEVISAVTTIVVPDNGS